MQAGETMERQQQVRMHRGLGRTDLSAISEVRGATRELLRHRWPDESTGVAELLLSELVTNALIHTGHGAVVTVTVAPERIRVEVRDFVTGLPMSHVPNADDGTHGRGLALVRNLADAWGVSAQALGKTVWFELDGGRS